VCEVEVPSRLHASVIDMNRFDVGSPGGGGVGFAVALFCRSRTVVSGGREVVASGNRPGIAVHLGRLFQAVTGLPLGVEIELNDHGRQHMGLGSSISSICAAAVSLNELFGRPFTQRDLRKLVAYNYCEEAAGDGRRLVPGFETNVGAMAGIHGGMVVASDDCELLCRMPFPEPMRALLILPQIGPEVASGDREAEALLTTARDRDRQDAPDKAYRILMDLLPAMFRGDLAAMGDVVYRLTLMGSKRAECSLHGNRGEEIFRTLEQLRAQGAEIVSMSSVGPAVFALSRRPEVWRRWQGWTAPGAASCALDVPVDNAGARVRIDGVPIPYRLEPWWHQPDHRPAGGTGPSAVPPTRGGSGGAEPLGEP
jgi:predicted sugar kinase